MTKYCIVVNITVEDKNLDEVRTDLWALMRGQQLNAFRIEQERE